jgi:hypothetical protein
MSAKVGDQNWDYERVMGKHGWVSAMIMEKDFVKCAI